MTAPSRHVTRRLVCFANLVIVVCVLLGSGGSAEASGDGEGCNPGRTAYSDDDLAGMYENDASVGAAKVTIDVYSPYVSPDSTQTTGWVMIVNRTSVDFAHVGWWESPGTVRHTFAEYGFDNGNGGDYKNFFAAKPVASSNKYKVTYAPNTTYVGFDVNGTSLESFPLPSFGTPNQAEVYGETHDNNSQVPGGTMNHEMFYNLETWHPAGGSGSYQTGSATTKTLSYSRSGSVPFAGISPSEGTGGQDEVQIWDKACDT